MKYVQDEDGRYPLSSDEYTAICMIIGAVHTLESNKEKLHDRLKLIKNGWRDISLLDSLCERLFNGILATVPKKKLIMLQKELRHMVCETHLNPAVRNELTGEALISNSALRKILNRAICMDCTFCEKSKHEARKCDLYRDISDCYPFEISNRQTEGDNKCPMAGVTRLEE